MESGADKESKKRGGGGGGEEGAGKGEFENIINHEVSSLILWKSETIFQNNSPDGEVDESEERMRRLERGGGGEGHVSSDEEDAADDADATDARKRARQGVGCGRYGLLSFKMNGIL